MAGRSVRLQMTVSVLQLTGADGVMSAEAMLDNPALYANINDPSKQHRRLTKKLREIERIGGLAVADLNDDQRTKLAAANVVAAELAQLPPLDSKSDGCNNANDELRLALEYLGLVTKYHTGVAALKQSTLIFHCRRICRDTLTK